MKSGTILTLLAMLTLPLAASSPKGTVPRSAADNYAAHAEVAGAAIGATLLTPKDVRKAFNVDLNRCCRVVEVALYPAKGSTMDVSPNDFVLRLAGTDTVVKASSATLLASQLQKSDSDGKSVSTTGEVHVGYDSGTDPMTGQRVHGVETGGSVGVGIGSPEPGPDSAGRDGNIIELELKEKALLDDTVSTPVAGHLYFALPKDNKKAVHELEYELNGEKVMLRLD